MHGGLAHRCLQRRIQFPRRQRRHHPFHQSGGFVFQNTGRIALAITHYLPARDVLRRAIDAGQSHGIGVHQHHVTVDPPHHYRIIGRDIVDQLMRR